MAGEISGLGSKVFTEPRRFDVTTPTNEPATPETTGQQPVNFGGSGYGRPAADLSRLGMEGPSGVPLPSAPLWGDSGRQVSFQEAFDAALTKASVTLDVGSPEFDSNLRKY